MRKRALLGGIAAMVATAAAAQAPVRARLAIVAAENFYGDIASQLVGPDATVTSILNNPDQDPHLFEASPSVARALSAARIAIFNGADYDPWMVKLLRAAKSPGRQEIEVSALAGRKTGDNPHLWYEVANAALAAQAITAALVTLDADRRAGYEQRLRSFLDSLAPLQALVAAMRGRHAGVPVTATEPVFGLMAAALGLAMRNERFQLAVMNGTEPRASDVAAFQADLRQHKVRALLYNAQASDGAAKRLLGIARQSGVPVVGVTETMPAGKTYQGWMTEQLQALDLALSKPAS